ncbi:dihydrofolate reductase family protein [Nocardia ninae]|uniref:Dihydrofolate reductase n=1 Tax=Nocardia ninae NBRC 108245 TaxID=1210091 RepID=A0A511MFB3_9NOCA|nr:dihydrofolate reductase family protein [Nocardia ninae]GEM39342.1 dihydrofolate reductase [Nocardia ninae NBRC 108245]
MRKLKLQVQTTADGYMGGPNGEMDWMTFPWTDDVGTYIKNVMDSVDTIVLGRNLAEGFIPVWANRTEADGEDQETIDWMNNTPKIVFSDTLTESPWPNTIIASGDLTKTVTDLKSQPGGDLIVYGGATLAAALIAAELIDELHLFVNPTAIGTGLPVFAPGTYQPLRTVAATPFDCGITALHYAPKSA